MRRPALFLDRDGVINKDHGYVHRREDIEFIDGIFDLVSAANRSGRLVVIVTNQAGIARGYYSEAQFHELMKWMAARFLETGCHIDAVYFSPYHPQHGIGVYKQVTRCRKPAPGMLYRAADELNIDLAASVLIGDRLTDLQAGQEAGVGTLIHYRPPEGSDSRGREEQVTAFPNARTIIRLGDAINYI